MVKGSRTGAAMLLGLATCASLCAQRAQLARTGRQPERGAPAAVEPVRKLPRKVVAVPVRGPAEALHDFIDTQRRLVQDRPTAEDRSRPLIRGMVDPLPPLLPAGNPEHILPRNMEMVAGAMAAPAGAQTTGIRNRWHIFPTPPWRRYDAEKLDAIYAYSRWWDPFNRNILKGDFPFFGRREFFSFTGSSETLVEERRVPVPAGASYADPGESGFFGRGSQFALAQNFRLSFDLFRGDAGFSPVNYELKVTPEFNINYLLTRENGLTNIDVANGIRRTDTAVGMQELYFEKRLFTNSASEFEKRKDGDTRGSAYFDFTSLRVGIQRFTSDFRGLIYSDEQPGARLFGTFHNNVFQYNLAYFNLLEKDSNSGLNRWRSRQESVSAANLYWSDFIKKGYTLEFSALYNHDQPSFLIDKNGNLVRPAPLGLPVPHKIRAAYAGIAGDGHIGRINVSHAFYEAFGRDDNNPVPAQNNAQHINAQLGALELAYEKDWMTFKLSGFCTSGDGKLNDGRANGFDSIVPNQQFAGGGFLGNPALADRGLINNSFEGGGTNFLNRELIPLTGTGVTLFGPNSLMPTMRAGAFEGQANFLNPGITLYNAGFDAKITPKLKSTLNVNWSKFNRTEVLEAVLFQSNIHHPIGLDSGIGLQYRPLLSDNMVVTGGVGALVPGRGFKDIYNGQVQFSSFVNVRLIF
jgi:hypothetical protein